MQAVKNKDRSRLIAAAMQKIACDLTVENVQFVNVITGEIYPASVDVLDGVVVRVRRAGETTSQKSARVYDGGGRYLVPGYFDTHMHVESTMMIPENFARAVVVCGTTSVIADPHEIGNVMGIDGVRFMLDNAKRAMIRMYCVVPSCVPSVVGAEGSGASFGAEEIATLLQEEGVLGVAEVMDFVGVINDVPRMHDIVQAGLERDMFIQGHAPGLVGKELAAYAIAGPQNDHANRSPQEVAQELRAGMHVNLQSSSLTQGLLPTLLEGMQGMRYQDNVSICTDDIHAGDILKTGHINRVIRHALELGMDAVDAIRFATYNPAREYGFRDLGAIAPGYLADMQLLDALDGSNPYAVFVGGKLVVEDGKLLDAVPAQTKIDFPNTVHMPQVQSVDDFRLKAPRACGDDVRTLVIDAASGNAAYESLSVCEGYVDISGDPALCLACVCNRYGSGDSTIAVYRNFGLEKGAVASTISHDCHNFTVVYRDAQDAFVAAQELTRTGGGITAVEDGAVVRTLALPVAGLMSGLAIAPLADEVERTEQAVASLCAGREGMLLKTAVLSLACVPRAVVTDRGVYHGGESQFIPVFA
jgi:adenine deaminase